MKVEGWTLGNGGSGGVIAGEIDLDPFVNATNLIDINLHRNAFTGEIKTTNSRPLSRIDQFRLDQNDLSGQIDWNIFVGSGIKSLWLNNNNFIGTIDWNIIRQLSLNGLSTLRLQGNAFSDINADFRNITGITNFRLDVNVRCKSSIYCPEQYGFVSIDRSEVIISNSIAPACTCLCSNGNNTIISPLCPNTPTFAPTNRPTLSPSNEPSIAPTNTPTIEPSLFPTNEPTILTIIPTLYPTRLPTQNTDSPSHSPTSNPTEIPTIATNSPSTIPTMIPTEIPTIFTVNPTRTTSFPSIETSLPSRIPTIEPTLFPTIQTINPTRNTITPSISTESPTNNTYLPTLQTRIPTLFTNVPTNAPTLISQIEWNITIQFSKTFLEIFVIIWNDNIALFPAINDQNIGDCNDIFDSQTNTKYLEDSICIFDTYSDALNVNRNRILIQLSPNALIPNNGEIEPNKFIISQSSFQWSYKSDTITRYPLLSNIILTNSNIHIPNNTVLPVIVLDAMFTQIGVCDNLILNAQQSYNFGGRNVTMIWHVFDSINNISTQYYGLYNEVTRDDNQTNAFGTYYITVELFTWYVNGYANDSIIVTRNADPIPLLTLISKQSPIYDQDDSKFVQIQALVTFQDECVSSNDIELQHIWNVTASNVQNAVALQNYLETQESAQIQIDSDLYLQVTF